MKPTFSISWMAVAISFMLAGCTTTQPPSGTEVPSGGPMPELPIEAGTWNGTTWHLHLPNLQRDFVSSIQYRVDSQQKCESSYWTEGNLTRPWAIGWSLGLQDDVAWMSATIPKQGTARVQAAGQVPTGSAAPGHVKAGAQGLLTVHPGVNVTDYFVASYPPESGPGGSLDAQVTCPEGMSSLVVKWSTDAQVFSDLSMNGTSAILSTNGPPTGHVRISGQGLATWTGTFAQEDMDFVSVAPVSGQVTLTSSAGKIQCGPGMPPNQQLSDQVCRDVFPGGNVSLEVSSGANANLNTSPGGDGWMGFVAHMNRTILVGPGSPAHGA